MGATITSPISKRELKISENMVVSWTYINCFAFFFFFLFQIVCEVMGM